MRRTKIYSRFEVKKNWKRIAAVIVLAILVTVAATAGTYANKYGNEAADQKAKYQNSQTEKTKLNTELKEMKLEKVEQEDSSKQQIQKLQDENKSLNDQLQAKIEQKTKLAAAEKIRVASSVALPKLPASIVSGCGENSFANHIYMHESSCNLTVTNAEGCIGIGQACPASKLLNICPDLSYTCQNNFFTGYAVARYGSWEGAYNFWINNHWW